MSDKIEKRSREWVKTAAIVFLIIMLVLTFFSNTIMNYSLPEVEMQSIYSGTIVAKVRGTGTVVAKDPYHIKATESRKIASVAVSNGDFVEKGAPLFYFDEKESEEIKIIQELIKTEEKLLEQLESAYKKMFLAGENTEALLDGKEGTIESDKELEKKVKEALKQKLAVEAEKSRLEGLLPALNRQLEILNSQVLGTEKKKEMATKTTEKEAQELIRDTATLIIEDSTSTQPEKDQAAIDKAAAITLISSLTTDIANLQTQINDLNSSQSGSIANINNQISQVNYAISLEVLKLKELQSILDVVGEKYTIEEAEQGIKDQKNRIAEVREDLNKLITDSKGTILEAPVAGIITNIAVVAGDMSVPEAELATIQIDGKGFTLEFPITKQQAQKLTIGDEAELVNNWYYSDIRLTLTKMKADPADPTKNKIAVFDLIGEELQGGENLTVSIGERSASYDLVVPNSAIHEDNDGKFILTVESKQSPLGNRYIAQRENVEVLAADDTQSAIKAALYGYEYVITTSTLPVEPGNQVRITEN